MEKVIFYFSGTGNSLRAAQIIAKEIGGAKAIQFKTPDAYIKLNNIITRRLGLPENRTRYHNPYITAADLMKNSEDIASLHYSRFSPE